MKLHLYTFAWNEARLVPYFLDHYAGLADRVVVYDNESTDGTADLLRRGGAEVRTYSTGNLTRNLLMKQIRDSAWKESRGKADWVYTPDFDEFLWHPDLPAFLRRAERHPIVRPFGYQMVAAEFPTHAGRLTDVVRRGYPNHLYSKPTLFQPDKVLETRFTLGAHSAEPVGLDRQRLPIYNCGTLKTLHMRFLGWDYYWGRVQELLARFYPQDFAVNGVLPDTGTSHYEYPEEKHRHDYEIMMRDAVDLML